MPTPPDWLRLRLILEENHLTLQISDNGEGLPANLDERDGEGFHNLRERLAGLGGTCRIRSGPGDGTVVTFSLPRLGPGGTLSTK